MNDERSDGRAAERIRRLESRLARERAARRESEQIAEDALRRLHEANELKSVLLGTINHELRTPATIVKGFAHQLEAAWDHHDDVTKRDMVDRMGRAAKALAALVEDVLELASLEVGDLAEVAEDVDLPAVAAGVAAQDGGRVEVDGGPVPLRAHPKAVRRVLEVLVDNARRFGPGGAPVEVAWWVDAEHVVLTVRDHGPGVPVAERSRIFEPFYRGSGEHVTTTSGVGAGLAVAKRLVLLHGGDVRVEAAQPHGARFTVRLPARTVDGDGTGDST
jgi:signal transduction histidine kinase